MHEIMAKPEDVNPVTHIRKILEAHTGEGAVDVNHYCNTFLTFPDINQRGFLHFTDARAIIAAIDAMEQSLRTEAIELRNAGISPSEPKSRRPRKQDTLTGDMFGENK